VILGAGFSKAVDPTFPLVDELGELVRARVPDALTGAPPRFAAGSFERWLSRIAEPQPDLIDVVNLGNARDFEVVAGAIHEIMVSIEAEVFRTEIPWWLLRFAGLLHAERATVVTFNYDTVVEAAAARTLRYGGPGALNTYSLTDGIPPDPPAGGGLSFGPSFVETFRLLKLHGSLDTYWVRGDSAGTSITRITDSVWVPDMGMSSPHLNAARNAPGRVPFIVPPASAKSAFFANSITRQLWQTAAERLAHCDQIAVIGYSIPMTDIVASAMLVTAQRASGAHIDIVNKRPGPVRKLLIDGGVPDAAIQIASRSCEGYVDQLERQVAGPPIAAIGPRLAESRPLAVAGAAGTVWPVVGLDVRGADVRLKIAGPQRETDRCDTSTWKTSTELLQVLTYSKAAHLTVTVNGETACVLDYVRPVSGVTHFAVLVPTAVRLPLLG